MTETVNTKVGALEYEVPRVFCVMWNCIRSSVLCRLLLARMATLLHMILRSEVMSLVCQPGT